MTAQREIRVRRVREAREGDEVRVLADRLWPRGVSKDAADLDHWAKEATPSTELRKAVHGGQIDWDVFVERYQDELAHGAGLTDLADFLAGSQGPVSLLIAADPAKRNHADVLADALRERMAAS